LVVIVSCLVKQAPDVHYRRVPAASERPGRTRLKSPPVTPLTRAAEAEQSHVDSQSNNDKQEQTSKDCPKSSVTKTTRFGRLVKRPLRFRD
jgi:hypothetical protein